MSDDKSFIVHGGDIYTQGKFKGIKLLDFSSNINFLGLPKGFKESINEALEEVTHYPDLKYRQAKLHIRNYLKTEIKDENIVLGNGAAELLNLSIGTLKAPCIAVPSFSEYEMSAKNHGAQITFCYLNKDFSYDYRDILVKLKHCDGLVIANPNNPNGGAIHHAAFMEILEYCEKNNKRIVMDEAFVEFSKQEISFMNLCKDYKCLFIVRALTKFFAMPGIRLGYGISSDLAFINKITNQQTPWNINTFAEVALKTVLVDQDYIQQSKVMLEMEKNYFYRELAALSFVECVYESSANFLLIKLKDSMGEALFEFALERNILIRRCINFRGLDDHYIRLAIKARQDNDRLIETFKHYEIQYNQKGRLI